MLNTNGEFRSIQNGCFSFRPGWLVFELPPTSEWFIRLRCYDTSLRLGAYLGYWPIVVYFHSGTKKGYKALGVATKGGRLERGDLPQEFRVLKPYQAEDFVCIFKDQFDEVAVKEKRLSERGV